MAAFQHENGQYSAITCYDITYKLTDADLDKYIKFEVTPKADGEPSAGLPVSSQPFGPITKSVRRRYSSGGGGILRAEMFLRGIQPGGTPTPTPTVTPSPPLYSRLILKQIRRDKSRSECTGDGFQAERLR